MPPFIPCLGRSAAPPLPPCAAFEPAGLTSLEDDTVKYIGGYFEGDVTTLNPFRDQLMDKLPYQLDGNGCVTPNEGTGIGLKIDLDFIAKHPLIEGPCYV